MSTIIPGYEEFADEADKPKKEKKKKKRGDTKKYKFKMDPDVTPEELEFMRKIADDIETYLDYFDTLCICDSLDPKEYEKSYDKIQELIAALRAGAKSKCFDEERYDELVNGDFRGFSDEDAD